MGLPRHAIGTARRRLAALLALVALACGPACSSSSGSPSGEPGPTAPSGPAPTATTPGKPAPTSTGATPPPGPSLTSIRVHYASNPAKPGALTLRGSGGPFTWDKGLPATSVSAGLYVWSTPDVKADLELKPLLDDTWSRGPNYRVKPGQTIDIYPHFVESHGTYAKTYPSFVSQKLPSTRGVWVYLPPTYIENTEARLGVLYMHDAQNLFDASLAFGGNEWKVDETMDAGSEDGSIREAIVVGIENTAARTDELTPTADPTYGGGEGDQYLAMIIDEIKPMIDKDLRTNPAREQTAIMGSSLGGLVSAYAGVGHADVFGLLGAMSPSTWWDNEVILGDVSSMSTKTQRPLRVYVDSGDSGTSNDDVTNTTELAARYRALGYMDDATLLHVVQAGGQHSEIYWAQRLPAALHFLLGSRPDG